MSSISNHFVLGAHCFFSPETLKVYPKNLPLVDVLSYKDQWHDIECGVINGKRIISEIALLMTGEDYGSPKESQKTKKIWHALQSQYSELKEKKLEDCSVDAKFIKHVFSPIIPDSPILKMANLSLYGTSFRKNHGILSAICEKIAHLAGSILLIAEMPLRYLAVAILNLGLKIYAFRNPNFAEYYRFRVNINRHNPLHHLLQCARRKLI